MKIPLLVWARLIFLSSFMLLVLLCMDLKVAKSLEIDLTDDNDSNRYKDQDLSPEDDSEEMISDKTKLNSSKQYDGQGKIGEPNLVIFNFKCSDKKHGRHDSSVMDDFFSTGTGRKHPSKLHHSRILISKLQDMAPQYDSKLQDSAPQYNSKLQDLAPQYDSKLLSGLFPDMEPPMSLPNRHFDPMFGIIDRMMDSLIQPIVNRPFNRHIIGARSSINEDKIKPNQFMRNEDDSSLKFWIKNEDTLTTQPKTLVKELHNNLIQDAKDSNKSEDIEPGTENPVFDMDYPDYKTDLWRKFNKNDADVNRSNPNVVSNNTDDFWFKDIDNNKYRTVDNKTATESKSNGELSQEKQESSNAGENDKMEDAWWYHMISPRKPIILRNRKKSCHGLGRMETLADSRGVTKPDELSNGKREIKAHQTQHGVDASKDIEMKEYIQSNSSEILSELVDRSPFADFLIVSIIGCMLALLMLMLKLSLVLYREYNMARLLGQFDYTGQVPLKFIGKAVVRPIPRRIYSNVQPPSYSLHVNAPAPPADTCF